MEILAAWRQELFFIVCLCLLALGCSYVFDLPLWSITTPLIGWLAWHLYNLHRLLRGLEFGIKQLPLETPGIWGYVFYRIQIRNRKSQTRKKQVRRLIKEFTTLAKALPDAAIIISENFEIQWSNKPARQLFKLLKSDVGRVITDLLRDPSLLAWLENKSRSKILEIPAPINPDTILSYQLIAYSSQHFLLVARDVTEEKQLDKLRENFIANASHELRTPLTVLQGTLEQMGNQLHTDPKWDKPLRWMKRQSDRMHSILEDLLILARLEGQRGQPGGWHTVSVGEILDAIIEDATAISDASGGHLLEWEIDKTIQIVGQYDPLYTLFNNLVSNALRYTPAGGRIYVSWRQTRNGAQFDVHDNGPGIAGRHIPRLTERFFRVEDSRSRNLGGTGLGLAIVKHVLDLYSTQLEIESTPGHGSRFGFTIPTDYLVTSRLLAEH